MTNAICATMKESKPKVKRRIWFTPLILLSILAIISFYSNYKFNEAVYVSKYLAIALFMATLIIYLSKSINWRGMITLTTFLMFISLLNFYNLPFNTPNIIVENFLNVLMYVSVAGLAIFVFPKISFNDYKTIMSVIFAVVLLFVTAPSLINVQNIQMYTDFDDRLRYISIFENPNELGRFALLGSILSLRLWFIYNGPIKKLIFIFMFFANLYLIYLADSRTSLASIVVLIAGLFVIWIYKKTPKYFFIGSVSIISSIFMAFIFYYVNAIGVKPVQDLNDVTSGRIEIWSSILNTNLIGYLFGTGPMLDLGSHNGYLEILKFFGLFGLTFWIIILAFLLFKKAKSALTNVTNSKIVGLAIVVLFFAYHMFEGSMVSIANIANIYFWLELSQRNE